MRASPTVFLPIVAALEGVASAGALDMSRPDGILANTAAPTVCITSDLPVTRELFHRDVRIGNMRC